MFSIMVLSTAFLTVNFYVEGAASTPGNRLVPSENWATQDIRDKTFAEGPNVA
jgi:hypothetical protein